MTLDEIFHQLATAHDIPKAAVRAAVQQADALVPDVLRLMDLASRNVMLTRPEERLLFYGVHALAAARRTELYEPLLRLTAERSYEMGWLVGEAGLNALLISSYAPGSRLPYELLENPHIHDETRSELFLLMAWLVWQGHASREDFVAFLDRIDRDESTDPDDFAWFGWQSAVVLLGLTEFEERMRAGWQAGRMRFDRDVDHGDWIRQLHQAARDPADGSNFSQFFAEPISDVFAALRKIPFFGFGRFRQQDVPDPADPARDIRLITDELQWLDSFLTSEIVPPDAMILECLDGFVTALAIGPQEVPRDEWWPLVWSESGKEMPEFTGDVPESYVRQLIDRHFKTIQMRLNAGYRHVPLIEEDSPLEDAEAWADGFSVGADLRADSWQVIGKHKDAGLAMAAIAMLTPSEQIRAHEGWPAPLGEAERCAVVARLPGFIRAIYACWRGLPVQPLFEPRRSQKIGRNEPCPCGSSRKYKKCCGANAPG